MLAIPRTISVDPPDPPPPSPRTRRFHCIGHWQITFWEMATISPQYGPILFAVCLNMILYGVLLCQTYTYYLLYRNSDPRLNKFLVIHILIVETAHTALTMYMIYEPLVVEFGNDYAVDIYPRVLSPIVALMGAVSLPTQTFIAWKIVRLQRSFWIGGIICILAAISFAGSMLSAYQIHEFRHFSQKRALSLSAVLWLTPGALADVLIAGSLSYSLYKRKTGLPSTDAVLSRIIRLTIQTGLVTSVAALLNLLTLVGLPIGNSVNFIFNITLMKTYANFLLATLNARASWKGGLTHINGSVLFADFLEPTSALKFGNGTFSPRMSFIRNIEQIGYPPQSLQRPELNHLSRTVDIIQPYDSGETLA